MSHLLLQADARRIPIADGTVHCVVTSPPYFGLRDYGTATWEGGDPACTHEKVPDPIKAVQTSTLGGGKKTTGHLQEGFKSACLRCGARRVDRQIGLEPTPDEFVASMVAVFRGVRRVLRVDGTLWLNLGDSYNAYNGGAGPSSSLSRGAQTTERPALESGYGLKVKGLKPKDLVGIPWRVALALQADGWYLRSDIIWSKPNPMPESVTDRPTKSHEYLFLLTKSDRYFYDADAIREPVTASGGGASFGKQNHTADGTMAQSRRLETPEERNHPLGRNKRSVWQVPVGGFAGAHFATFPTRLIEPCIKAGCPVGGIVLDPFNGAATTGVVSLAHGRLYVGLDLNADYLAMSRRRIERPHAPVQRAKVATPEGGTLVPLPGQRSLFDAFTEAS